MVIKTGNPTYRHAAWHLAFANTKFNFYTSSTARLTEPEFQRHRAEDAVRLLGLKE